MSESEKIFLLALLQIEGIGPVNAKNLIAYCGSAEAIFNKSDKVLQQIPGIGPKLAATVRKAAYIKKAEKEIAFCNQNQIQILTYLDEAFPKLLKTDTSFPALIFKRGNLELNQFPAVSIVGTRSATVYGKEQAAFFSQYLAAKGINIVSGLAYGIDIEAHKAALHASGITTAIMATGLNSVYPATHKEIANKILAKGAWISEQFSHANLSREHFLRRNRIIAGLSMATIVIESSKKGGALVTAQYAFNLNREVFAVPGSLNLKTSEGCNNLIKNNTAKLISHPEEILTELGIEYLTPKTIPTTFTLPDIPDLTDEEQAILKTIAKKTLTFDELGYTTHFSTGELNAALLTLELRGLINQLPGRKFSIKHLK
jgi:DNA processing protein